MILQCYHRVIGSVYSEGLALPRFVKVLANMSQMLVLLALTGCLSYAILDQMVGIVICTFIMMRLVQIAFNMLSVKTSTHVIGSNPRVKEGPCGGSRNSVAGFAYTVILVVGNFIAIVLAMDYVTTAQFNKWGKVFFLSLILELIVWDFILMPMILIIATKACKKLEIFSPHITKEIVVRVKTEGAPPAEEGASEDKHQGSSLDQQQNQEEGPSSDVPVR